MISSSTSGAKVGRPGERRFFEPASLCATSPGCQAKMASGETMAATSVSLAAERLADIGQRSALAVGEPETAADLSTRNAVLRGEVLVAEKQLLVN